jgi:hypothetical protein
MPRGPQGQRRPAECAIMVAKIATGELEPVMPMSGRMRSGKAGAKARVNKTTAAQRTEIAKKQRQRVGNERDSYDK